MTPTEQNHADMVKTLVKPPIQIFDALNTFKCDLMHATFGIAGEAGEMVDNVKKAVVYNQIFNRANMVEELGDMEFYLEQLRQCTGITREETLLGNMEKLAKRYPQFKYTDTRAKERADKVGE